MIIVTSTYANTPIVPANAHGPYVVPAGAALTFSAGAPNAAAGYSWDLGDGTVANTPNVTHSYGKAGIYVAKLTIVVNAPGGARTRNFAQVVVTDVTPNVELTGPDTIDEGSVGDFSGTFTDAAWLDTHTGTWDWDDASGSSDAILNETNNPPTCAGTVTGQHAWGHSGTYRVTLSVRDDQGVTGRATRQIAVLNVPPTVRAPHEVFAYPCTVTTLRAAFTDPGWLNRHVAIWHFGERHSECVGIVAELHNPPIGRGTATASHIYHELGTYRARCVVTDDDGAQGHDDTIVHVVDVRNRHFEEGFHLRLVGEVANEWEPYSLPLPAIGPGQPPPPGPPSPTPFSAQAALYHGGEQAQRIRPAAGQRAGLWQRVGANPEWQYQLTAWYSLAQRADEPGISTFDPASGWARPDCMRLGIDPQGGTDPSSPSIVWTRDANRLQWRQLGLSVIAKASAVTLFLEADGGDLVGADGCFDDVRLLPTCRILAPRAAPPVDQACATFGAVPLGQIAAPLVVEGFAFTAPNTSAFEIVSVGAPTSTHKLALSQQLRVSLPWSATAVVATIVALQDSSTVILSALDSAGTVLVSTSRHTDSTPSEVTVSAASIHSVVLTTRSAALLIKLCASRSAAMPTHGDASR